MVALLYSAPYIRKFGYGGHSPC